MDGYRTNSSITTTARTSPPQPAIEQSTPVPASKLFISYSHDSPHHQDRVRALADRLHADGIDAHLGQYAPAPPEGWSIWMDTQIRTQRDGLLKPVLA